MKHCRHLVFILGDQLDENSPALADFDTATDIVLMAEVREESTQVWSSKPRTAFFFAAMRHFAAALEHRGIDVDYRRIGTHAFDSLVAALAAADRNYRPERIVLTAPGDWRVEQALLAYGTTTTTGLVLRDDTHFLCSRQEFADWAKGYKRLRLEYFYRVMRKRHAVMMDGSDPVQGRWNFDAENREAFAKAGPKDVPAAPWVPPDAITTEAIADVEAHFAGHPGTLDAFGWPVTRKDSLRALKTFVDERLPAFGRYQDAMWTDEPFLYHSCLSAAMNVKLLNPREVIAAAVEAFEQGRAPIEAVEGFVRQVLGWREFVRGVYWLDMPGMREANHFGHARKLPAWYWTGKTQMNCMQHAVGQTMKYGYAHHIQRLMVTGIFGLLAEIAPKEIEDWYLAAYVDAVEWVELPNVAGMALYANAGRITSKPYVASGQYIKRMSNYCAGCCYRPEVKTGARACPITTLYWHFLDKHEPLLSGNPRTSLMAKGIARMPAADRAAIRTQAAVTLRNLDML
ncbi:MAG: cryptochrome/photolyase family protein [Burkholderiales bacterium]